MKRAFILLATLVSLTAFAQKKKKDNILNSTNIQEIEAFLQTAHPEDPRRTVLKQKLIAIKNSEWLKGKSTANPMEARPVITDIPKKVQRNENSAEAEEFKNLIAETSTQHKEKTVKLLNTMFDQDINKKEAILLVQNNSDCNMIVRIEGKTYYNLAVPAHGENSIVIEKGSYTLSSNVCDIKYTSSKEIAKSMVVILNNPIYHNIAANSSDIDHLISI